LVLILAGALAWNWVGAANSRAADWQAGLTPLPEAQSIDWNGDETGWLAVELPIEETYAVWSVAGSAGRCALVRADGSAGTWAGSGIGPTSGLDGVTYRGMVFRGGDNALTSTESAVTVYVACVGATGPQYVGPVPAPILQHVAVRPGVPALAVGLVVFAVGALVGLGGCLGRLVR